MKLNPGKTEVILARNILERLDPLALDGVELALAEQVWSFILAV